MTKKRCRLAIIGAGPAGCFAGLTAARAGIDVMIFERGCEVGKPLACAEAVSHDGLSKFVDPDHRYISTDITSIKFTMATGYSVTHDSDELLGYVLDRPTFDSYLAEQAVGFGADLHTGTWARGIDISSNGAARIELQTMSNSYTVEADYVIATDGVESMIGRMAGLKTTLKLKQCDATLQYRVTDIDVDPNCLEFCVGDRYSPNGYLWIFPKSDHSANIGLGLNPAESSNSGLREFLDRFLRDRYHSYRIEYEVCGMVGKFIGLDVLGRDNLLLAGDAARTVDSLTGAGINKALHTGGLAAGAVVAAVREKLSRRVMQEQYRSSIKDELGRELTFFRKAYAIFRKFSNEDWESFGRFLERYLKKQKAGSIDPAAMVKAALLNTPQLIRMARHIF